MNKKTEDTAALSHKAAYKVPFGTVSVTKDARKLVDQAFESNWLTRGKYVQEFEEKFADLFGVKYAVAVSSGTDADALACAVLYDYGAKRGDEVIVPALTFVATANAVLQAGLMPVFVDVNRETLNMDVQKIEAVITEKTKAIMPVHLMGKPAEMNKIMELAKKYNLKIIEDAAEAHGAEYKGQKIGSIGDMAAFSLYAAHIVTTIEGGMVITSNENMADALRSLRNHGMVNKFNFQRIGFSAKMNELEAAVGIGNIAIFSDILNQRCSNLLSLIDKFKEFEEWFITLKQEDYEKIGPHAFSIILKDGCGFTKEEFDQYINDKGIDSRNLFYSIPTQCPSYEFMNHSLGEFPEAEYCSDFGVHIGIHQDLNESHMEYIADVVREFLKIKGKI